METEPRVIQIQGNRYESSLLNYMKDFPTLYNEYLRKKRFGISCKYVLELTSNVYWHYINFMYFPLNWFPAIVDFDLILRKISQNIQNLAWEACNLNPLHILKVISSQEVYEAVRFLSNDFEENFKIVAPNSIKSSNARLCGIDLPTDDSDQLKNNQNSVTFHQCENNSSRFSDIVFRQSSDSLNNSYSDIEDGFINRDDWKLSDIISYLEAKLNDKQDSICKTVDFLKTQVKEQQSTFYDDQTNKEVLVSKIGQDLKENYDKYISEQNPFLLHSYLPYSKDDAEIKLTTNQNIFYERKRIAFERTNQPMCKAFDLNLSLNELKSLEPDFVNIDDACLVWNKGDYTKDNLIIYCDKCNWMVHQKWYDLKVIPEGKWFWYKWEVFDKEHLNLIKCTMCQQYGGIMKPSAYFAKSSIYESVQKERRNSFGGKQENLTVNQIIQIEKEHYIIAKKNIEIYGKFQTYFHWAHIGWWYWKDEFKEINHDSPIEFNIFSLEDFNKQWQLCSSKDGITHKCQSCDYIFHYECGRRRNWFFCKIYKLKAKSIKWLCFNHRPNSRIKEIEKNKHRKTLEIAETWVSLKYFSEVRSQIETQEKDWNSKWSKKLKRYIYKQIKECWPINLIVSKNKDNTNHYISGVDSIFHKLMRGGVLDWNKINIRSHNIDFLKHMFYKEWSNPVLFREFIAKFSQNYLRRHTKKVLKENDKLPLIKGPFYITQDKQKSIKLRKVNEFEWGSNFLPSLSESDQLIDSQKITDKLSHLDMSKIDMIEIPKYSMPIEAQPTESLYDPKTESLVKALQEEDIGITRGNLFDEKNSTKTFCICHTESFKESNSRILTWK